MHGIVSLLDEPHTRRVEALWAELKEEFGAQKVFVTPFPHFSYQVAKAYDLEQLSRLMEQIVCDLAPFRVRTTGLGLFTHPSPVLYLPVVRSPKLSELHSEVFRAGSRAGSGVQSYYAPDRWMPHVTLGHGDLNAENLARILPAFHRRDFNWDIVIDNLALIYDTGARQELRGVFRFKGEA
jgi:2'-5' RNA ligase